MKPIVAVGLGFAGIWLLSRSGNIFRAVGLSPVRKTTGIAGAVGDIRQIVGDARSITDDARSIWTTAKGLFGGADSKEVADTGGSGIFSGGFTSFTGSGGGFGSIGLTGAIGMETGTGSGDGWT